MKSVDQLMRQAVSEHIFPGAQLLVSHAGKILFNEAYGLANIFTGQAVTRDTVFDLASLTKPLATTLAVMKLIQENKLCLEQTIASVIPGFVHTPKEHIQIQHLLYHTSGLPDYRPYYLDIRKLPAENRKEALHEKLISEPLISPIGKQTRYSDIGFMILEWVVELLSNNNLGCFVKDSIYDPLGIDNLFFIAHEHYIPERNYAATELCPWREELINGKVHDDNAFVVGGVAGHAGLFGTADAVHCILSALLNAFNDNTSGQIFDAGLVRLFLQKKTSYPERVLGFDVPSKAGSSSGELFARSATVGHLGFTGTSFWMDLHQQVIVILLSNRVHPSRKNERIKTFRPLIHDRVMHCLKSRLLM